MVYCFVKVIMCSILGQSQRAFTSIIRTETSSTTSSKTTNAFRRPITARATLAEVMANGAGSISTLSAILRPNGMDQKRGWHGIRNTARERGIIASANLSAIAEAAGKSCSASSLMAEARNAIARKNVTAQSQILKRDTLSMLTAWFAITCSRFGSGASAQLRARAFAASGYGSR